MSIVLLGKNGQLGFELQRALAPLGEVIALDRHSHGDLTDLKSLVERIETLKPKIIVNAAAYTAVDKAETERTLARQINTEAPMVLAAWAKKWGALFVHYSTDYVFDGSSEIPWLESSLPSPINYYGRTKLDGEEAIIRSGCAYLIFRTSWVYSYRGTNFIKTILKLAKEREQLEIVADQVGVPTSARFLADATRACIVLYNKDPNCQGLYHLAPLGETNWYHYARFIVETASKFGFKPLVSDIMPIQTKDYKTMARRPLNSRLNCDKLQRVFSLTLEDWKVGVIEAIQEIQENQ